MMSDFARFGDPGRFEIALRWRSDTEPRARRPAGYGWSMGDIAISISDINLTEIARGPATQRFASWYLFPIAAWLADSWGRLLHEEEFAWPERSAAPAATVVTRRMHGLVDARDYQARADYRRAQEWRSAHALGSASNGGLLPDLYLRRYLDMIELSWTSGAPLFAPDQFRFTSEPGVAYLPVSEVAIPLWAALQWVVETSAKHVVNDADVAEVVKLTARLEAIQRRTVVDFAAYRIGREVAEAAAAALQERGLENVLVEAKVQSAPAVARFSPAVAMYGGLAPNLAVQDVATLSDVVADAFGRKEESVLLKGLVVPDSGPPVRAPYVEGDDLALELLEQESVERHVSNFVDVVALLQALDIEILHRELVTKTIRGVSLAGERLAPTIVVNRSSVYNETEQGIRFTLAHELAHLLYDRSMATSVGISSGPWAPAGIEKRANAFAATLLMPRWLVLNAFGSAATYADQDEIGAAAARLKVSTSALVERLFNIGLIDEYERDTLRISSRDRASRWQLH
jgi:Zn-dependent peptidase ImmA (M78 family)